jgi:Zn-finger nucleic acid-binding protein
MEDAGVQTQAHLCPDCQGTYFSSNRLDVLQDVVKVDLFPKADIPTRDVQLQPITCPVCGGQNTMEKVPSPRNKDVLMDVCRRCGGTWLDHGELDAIQREGFMKFLVNMLDWFRRN